MTSPNVPTSTLLTEFSFLGSRKDAFQPERAFMKKLPTEILLDIFLTCTYIEYDDLPHIGPALYPFSRRLPDLCSLKSPLKLCHICSGWRNLALNTSVLWSRFSLKLPRRYLSRLRIFASIHTGVWCTGIFWPTTHGASQRVHAYLLQLQRHRQASD